MSHYIVFILYYLCPRVRVVFVISTTFQKEGETFEYPNMFESDSSELAKGFQEYKEATKALNVKATADWADRDVPPWYR